MTWDTKHQSALLAWKCNKKMKPCKASGWACPFVLDGADVVQFKKCQDVTPWDWEQAIKTIQEKQL